MINICRKCWNRIFGTARGEDDFFIRGFAEKCDFCGRKTHLINGLVDEESRSTDAKNSASVSKKPYRTVTFDEGETLRHALNVVRVHRQALQRRRLPKLPEDDSLLCGDFELDR